MSKRKKLIQRLKENYKLMILNDTTFEEKASFKASLWYLIIGTSAFAIILVFLTIVIIRVTPLKEYLTGITDVDSKRNIVTSFSKVDSLEKLVHANDLYLENLKNVINGNIVSERGNKTDSLSRKAENINLNQEISKEERELRKLIESESQFDLNADNLDDVKRGAEAFAFFSPVKGKVSSVFDANKKHYAVDVAAKKNENIKASLDGTVVLANFTSETGYVIGIQHANNMLTFYKHCSVLLKKVGSFVRAGEVIAIVGDTGEYTTGPHLHFELWVNGLAVNPENYISF